MDTKFLFKYLKKLPGKWLIPVIAAIWVVGVGFRLISTSLCIILTALIVGVWLLYLLFRWIQSKGKLQAIAIVPELEDFEKKLISANKTAKNTPWYLFIGPQGCGKTSLLRNSNLDFSYIDSDQQPEQSIEKTKNCDLFYTRQGIILDTSGRYVNLNKEAKVRKEWLGLLTLMKKHRGMRPIEGLVVAVDIERLLQDKESVIKDEARRLRECIIDAVETLEITFPIYLVFTKCDVIYGFSRFFGGMDSGEREQVWGATLGGSQQEDPQAAFRNECKALVQSLNSHRLAKLAAAGQAGSTIYAFPLEFDSVCQKLAPFVDELFHLVVDEKPVFRGFYFTSGSQVESSSVDFMLKDVARSLGSQPPSLSEPKLEENTRTYFVREMFQRVIFPDRGLDRPTTGAERRRKFTRLGYAGVVIAVLLILGIIFGVSYIKNKRLINHTETASASVNAIDNTTVPVRKTERYENLLKDIISLEKFALFSLPWRSRRDEVAYYARKLYLLRRYGSIAGVDKKLTRKVKIPVGVFQSDAGELKPIEKAEIKTIVNGKARETLITNKNGEATLNIGIADGRINVTFSTDYELPGYEVQRKHSYQVQPGKTTTSESVRFVFSKSGRAIMVHCADQFGEDLPGVPVSIIEKDDESKKYGPSDSNEKGIASLSLEAPDNTVLLVYYGSSATNYSEEQPDTIAIQAGEARYSLEKRLRRKLDVSVIAIRKNADGSIQQPESGVTVSVGGTKIGLTDNSGSWIGPSDTIPTRQNVAVTPKPDSMNVEATASGYIIKLEYILREKTPVEDKPKVVIEPKPEPEPKLPVIKLDKSAPADIEVWMYVEPGDDSVFDSSSESDRMQFKSDGKQIRLVRLAATKDKEQDLKIPKEAENHQLLLWHPDYWPLKIQWQQTAQPLRMTRIEQERSLKDFGKVERDGSEYYFQSAQKYHNEQNQSQAIRDYLNAIRLSPRLPYYLRLGWAYLEEGQDDKALKEANRGMEFKLADDPEIDEKYLKEQMQNLREQVQ